VKRKRLAGKNCGNHVAFQVSFSFLPFFVLFRKTVVSTHKAVANKTPDQTLPYSDKTLFRNKAANLGHSRAAQPNCSGNVFVGKRNQCLFTIYTGKPVGLGKW